MSTQFYGMYVTKLIPYMLLFVFTERSHKMQLRNGKKTIYERAPRPVQPTSFIERVREALNRHEQAYNTATYYEKVANLLSVFNIINDQPVEVLSGIGDDYKFMSTIYKKTVELTCIVIEHSYQSQYTDDEKIAIIRLLSVMYQVRCTVSHILWDARTRQTIQDMMENGDRHSDQLYRCLKHMVSDESESYDYEIYKYEDGEYTDVELYDWYLQSNYYKNSKADTYIANADDCFGGEIRRYNRRLWYRGNQVGGT